MFTTLRTPCSVQIEKGREVVKLESHSPWNLYVFLSSYRQNLHEESICVTICLIQIKANFSC